MGTTAVDAEGAARSEATQAPLLAKADLIMDVIGGGESDDEDEDHDIPGIDVGSDSD